MKTQNRSLPMLRALSVALLVTACGTIAIAQTNSSVYTSLNAKQCRTIRAESSAPGDYLGRCKGVNGYVLLVSEGDLRQNIIVVTPRGNEHSLELWSVVSGGFSNVGPKVEWRMARQNGKLVPTALIVRFNANEDPADSSKVTSYLVVSKISTKEICVTDKVAPGANANENARKLADTSQDKPCLNAP